MVNKFRIKSAGLVLILCLASFNAAAQQTKVVVVPLFGEDPPPTVYFMDAPAAVPVPPSGTGGSGTPPTISSITVPATISSVQDVNVIVDISHTWNSDLEVSLKHVPSDTTAELWADVGGSGNNTRVMIDDSAALALNTTNVPGSVTITGTFKSESGSALNAFRGLNSGGEWQLLVGDDTGGDSGTLNSWVLQIRD